MPDFPTTGFPAIRMRRNRREDAVRRLVAENTLTPSDFIWPLFVVDGVKAKIPVESMPGVYRYSPDFIADAVLEAQAEGIPAVALFPYTDPRRQDRRWPRGGQSRKPCLHRDPRGEGGGARHDGGLRRRPRPLYDAWP